MKKILYFSAEWCNPCKLIKPKMVALSATLPIQIIDIDKDPALATKYNIRNIPAVIVVDGIAVTARLVGNNITQESVTHAYNQ
jgi:thioredoxin 1